MAITTRRLNEVHTQLQTAADVIFREQRRGCGRQICACSALSAARLAHPATDSISHLDSAMKGLTGWRKSWRLNPAGGEPQP